MLRILKTLVWLGVIVLLGVISYGYLGYRDARLDAVSLAPRADALIADGKGGRNLGSGRQTALLRVQDPAFFTHAGIDMTTAGAGATTITQSLAKREGFADFAPGLMKIRQIGYALGLETRLTKPQILALFLDSVPMGRGADQLWINGMYPAAQAFFGQPVAELSDTDFHALLAVMIAPRRLELATPGPALRQRKERISRLLARECEPLSHDDVWLDGCAEEVAGN